MKKMNVLMASLGALALASAADAQTVLRISGSSAFRAATHQAIGNILTPGYSVAFAGTDLTAAGSATYTGNVGTTAVVIQTSWSGSTAGVYSVAKNVNNSSKFILAGTAAGGGAVATETAIADVAMSDARQSLTPWVGPGFANLTDKKVGVVTFVWAMSATSADATTLAGLDLVKNISALQAKQILSSGVMPLSQLVGDNAYVAKPVYLIGRDEDSGTRIATFAESGFGVASTPTQYKTSTTFPISTLELFPAVVDLLGIPGNDYPAGSSGYPSGSNVKDRLNASVNASITVDGSPVDGAALISYMGISDAQKLTRAPLAYNGVLPFVNFAADHTTAGQNDKAVQEGTYTFWTHEHLLYRSTLAAGKKAIADALATRITNFDATASGVILSSMKVDRLAEGGVVFHK